VKFALVNPNWSFEGSIYFGCREPHLPLEYGYAKTLLGQAGHEARIVDGQMRNLSLAEVRSEVESFGPDVTVITTAPSYLFWRCAPPELRIPQLTVSALQNVGGKLVGVGPHASTTPKTTLRKLGVDAVILGEFEDILPHFSEPWWQIQSICYYSNGEPWIQGTTHATDMTTLPALHWPDEYISRHGHHHHRFEAPPLGPGAEVETSRGCPYHCTFCAKDNFRDRYRRRSVPIVLEEIDRLLAQGVEYIYFIDEIFLPNKELLEGLAERTVKIGIQTRIDLWSEPLIDLLGRAGCVSIEAGVESITEEGRAELDKKCKMSTDDLAERLIYATQLVPFVQANLIEMEQDNLAAVEQFRERLLQYGVWSNKPVPLYPYPGSPDYTKRWGQPDGYAWERAHDYYLNLYDQFSDIQEQRPLPLRQLELSDTVRH
jgi:anaerobic magnesium-protoporphyrin IX monomethyl ester cyclase